jgi:CHAT domain-containing protein
MSTMDDVAVRHFVRYDGRQEIVLPAMALSRRSVVFIAFAIVFACAGWFLGGRAVVATIQTRSAIERLASSAPRRVPAARFTALRGGVPVQAGAATRGREDDVDLRARVSRILEVSSSAPYSTARSASAFALVVDRDWRTAVSGLETAVGERPNDAGLWSDLAAARYERSVAFNDVESLLSALAAADRSRRIDPKNSNALFNRALILEQLGLRTVAADAWRACRDAEDASVSLEARRRLSNETESWKMAQPKFEHAAANGDSAEVERIIANFPQDARGWGEVMYLTYWANAYLAGDPITAAKNLQIARATGAALRPRGDTLLADAVAGIDGASSEALRTIAVAQQTYDRGRDAYGAGQFVEAERLMKDAARGFAQTRHPMGFWADMYSAFAILDQSRLQEAHQALTAMAADVRTRSGHRSLLAHILWMQGKCDLLRGHWNESIDALSEARTIFLELGETKNAGFMDRILAEDYERIGRLDLAWQHWAAALRGVSEEGNAYGLMGALSSGSNIAMWTQSWNVAASLIELELSVAKELQPAMPRMAADAHRRLYIVENERKEWASRDTALMRARIAAAHAGDVSQKQLAEIDQAEAVVAMQRNPGRAIGLLTRALEFAAKSDQYIFMADLLWNRGRAHLAAGEKDAARADFLAGIEELEKQRGTIGTPELRARFFDASEGLFDDTVDLLADRGDAAVAFQVADRAKARALLEIDESAAVPAPLLTPAVLAERLPNAALVEFAVLDRGVVVFCVRNGDVRMQKLPIAADALRKKIEALRQSIANEPVERMRIVAAELYENLFGAIGDQIESAESLIIVPDDDLQRVPFGALWQRSKNQYLAQSHVVTIAPSAAVIARRTAPVREQRSVLLIGNAAGNEEESLAYLPSVNDEIASLRRVYRSSRVLFGTEASKARFMTEVAAFDVIHFAGHGLSDDESLTASLLLARSDNDSGRLYMSDIAALRLPRAPLVVLAACGTLRGRVGGVEGMPSLARSFLAAGASTVVGTLWDTDDAGSVQLLTSFHRSIAANASPAVALRNAQLEAIARGGENAEPRNWAQYVIYAATP